MQVILLENIEGLGRKGEQVDVRSGYGRNFLVPHHRAILATPDSLSRLDSMRTRFAAEEARVVSALQGVASQLAGLSIELTMRATPEGNLFGSVSAHLLAQALAERGFKVAERDIRMKEPIKTVGTFDVPVHLHHEVRVSVSVTVHAEGEAAEGAASEGGDTETGDKAAKGEAAAAAPDAGGTSG
jgi:large subunit ribosomal protein L9